MIYGGVERGWGRGRGRGEFQTQAQKEIAKRKAVTNIKQKRITEGEKGIGKCKTREGLKGKDK